MLPRMLPCAALDSRHRRAVSRQWPIKCANAYGMAGWAATSRPHCRPPGRRIGAPFALRRTSGGSVDVGHLLGVGR
jgi:hypothetical protein